MTPRVLVVGLSIFLPWPARRIVLNWLPGFKIHRTSRIGFSWICPRRLVMHEHSRIGHLTVCKGLDLLELNPWSSVGRMNWITGFPSDDHRMFSHQPERKSELILGAHAAITNRHLIDATSSVVIGDFTTVAGWGSQILTHSIDLALSRQSSRPIHIGRYCFVGTDCVLLGGSALPDYAVLGAKSLLNRRFADSHWLYGGSPSRPIKPLPKEAEYFRRRVGFVW